MGLLSGFDINNNFWTCNPQLQIAGPFKELHDKDKSKNKAESSRIMWGIGFVYDVDSKYYNIPLEARKRLIAVDWFKDPKFDWDALEKITTFYKECCTTAAERALDEWHGKMTERAEFMKNTPYTAGVPNPRTGALTGGTAPMLDNMLGMTKKLYDDYQRIKEELEKESGQSKVKGGATKSASEAKLL